MYISTFFQKSSLRQNFTNWTLISFYTSRKPWQIQKSDPCTVFLWICFMKNPNGSNRIRIRIPERFKLGYQSQKKLNCSMISDWEKTFLGCTLLPFGPLHRTLHNNKNPKQTALCTHILKCAFRKNCPVIFDHDSLKSCILSWWKDYKVVQSHGNFDRV